MILLRCTQKLFKELNVHLLTAAEPDLKPKPLEEWYAHLFFYRRKKCIMLMHAVSLFSVVIPDVKTAEYKNLPVLFKSLLSKVLFAGGFTDKEWEKIAILTDEFRLAGTGGNRSLLASINDRIRAYRYGRAMQESEGSADLYVDEMFNRIPMGAIGYAFPHEVFKKMLSGESFIIAKRLPSPGMVAVFKIELMQDRGNPARGVKRTIAISERNSLYQLAEAIIGAYGFDFDHCFGFYDQDRSNPGCPDPVEAYELFYDIPDCGCDEGVKSVEWTKISSVFKDIGKKMWFQFDYGDNWMFTVELMDHKEKKQGERLPREVEVVGKAPLQYPPCEEESEIWEDGYPIETGLGGNDEGRLRYCFIVRSKDKREFSESGRTVIRKSFDLVAKNLDSVIEEIMFKNHCVKITALCSMDIAPADFIESGIERANRESDLLLFHYYATNIGQPSDKDIEKYLKEIDKI